MNDFSAAAFRDLIRLLEQAQLGWVVEEVQETISEGQLMAKVDEPRTGGFSLVDVSSDVGSLASRGLTTQPFTSDEQLGLLIDAVRRVSLDVRMVVDATREILQGEARESDIQPLVYFVQPGQEVSPETLLFGDQSSSAAFAEASTQLVELLEEQRRA